MGHSPLTTLPNPTIWKAKNTAQARVSSSPLPMDHPLRLSKANPMVASPTASQVLRPVFSGKNPTHHWSKDDRHSGYEAGHRSRSESQAICLGNIACSQYDSQ